MKRRRIELREVAGAVHGGFIEDRHHTIQKREETHSDIPAGSGSERETGTPRCGHSPKCPVED